MTDISSQHVDRKSRQWMERTLILKREDNGFGFTLTKEMPVFVDKVFNGSSAQKAGIQPNDRITKVNGVNVMSHKHQEVVDMIKDSSHVTLTVLGANVINQHHRSSFSSESSTNIEISPPRQLQELTLQSLKMMLHKQKKQYESLSVDYSKQRTEKLEKDLRECEGIIRILTLELASKSSAALDSMMQATSASVQALTPGKSRPAMEEKALRLLGLDADLGLSGFKTCPPNKLQRTGSGDLSPRPCRSHTFSNGSIAPNKAWKSPFTKKTDLSEDDGSDEDLSDEVDGASESGPFSSLQELKGNPGHMSVFLHYLFMSKDPKHLLFYLVASSYQVNCKTVEMLKQRGTDIYWTFFTDNAPLYIDVDDAIKKRMVSTLESEESDSKLKSVFVEARESLSETIITALGNYRHKRVLGLASIFGDQYVTNHMPISKQLDVVVNLLTQDLKTCLDEKLAPNVQECIKNQAIAACMATFLVDVLTAGNRLNAKVSSAVEKVQPFTRPDILQKKGKSKKKIPSFSRNGHNFHLSAYKVRTNCDVCGLPLWGVIYHGYQCSLCEINIHKFCCHSDVQECSLLKKSKNQSRRSSSHVNTPRRLTGSSAFQMLVPEDTEASKEALGVANTEEEDRQLYSPADSTSARGEEAEEAVFKRNRAPSEAKVTINTHQPRHSLPTTSGIGLVGGANIDMEVHGDRDRPKIERTLSEKLQSKPDMLKQRSSDTNTFSWGGGELHSSDEAQLSGSGKQGSSELIPDKQHLMDEDMKELMDDNVEEELIPWALVARREVVQSMKRHEVARQENIRELVYTERTHLHKLKIMKYMYKIPLQRQNILTAHQVEQMFPSLEELILFHSGLCADLKERVGSSSTQDSVVVKNIADVLLHRFDGAAGERLCHACSVFASNQAKADKLTKEWRRKNERFRLFLKTAETHPLCQRLTLTELMPIAWTRLTRYKLLIENIYHTYKKHWDNLEEDDRAEANQVETSISCVQGILKYVNKQVKKASNRQKLANYQAKMDVSGMEKAHHPSIQMFKQLDLTSDNRMLLHEGPLTCRMQYRKVVDVHVLLLTDVLVLLEKHEDKDKFYLRAHTVESVGGAKEELSTVIKLKDCLLRTAAADRGGRTFLLVNNSSLMKFAQIYEFTAESPKEKKRWEESIQRAMMGTWSDTSPEIPSSPTDEEFGGPIPVLASSGLNTRDRLNKIDDDIKKLMNRKLEILRAIQGGVPVRSSESTPQHTPVPQKDTPKTIVQASLEQTGEIISTVSHIMVPNPTRTIVAETQARLTDIISELERNLSKLMLIVKDDEDVAMRSMGSLDFAEDGSSDNLAGDSDSQLENSLVAADSSSVTGSLDLGKGKHDWNPDTQKGTLFDIGEEAEDKSQPEIPHHLSSSSDASRGNEDDDFIVSPPEVFAGENCATPTPGNVTPVPRGGTDSGTSTPRYLDSPNLDSLSSGGKVSPLAAHLLKADRLSESPNQTKIQSSNISHALHESHTTTPGATNGSTRNDDGDTVPPSTSEVKQERTKLTIAPRDSPAAMATDRVLGILSKNSRSSNVQQSQTRTTSDVVDDSDNPQRRPAKQGTNQSNSANAS